MPWTQSTIILMRHGEPSAYKEPSANQEPSTNKEPLANNEPSVDHELPTSPIFRGITDDVLSAIGWQQMDNAVRELSDIDNIICSPLRRCSEFARKLARQRGLSLRQSDALKEINFGQWEGQSVQQIASESGPELKNFWQNPLANTPPGGEPVLEFQHRVIEFWQQFLTASKGQNSLIITHGGVQKIILATVLDMPVQAVHNIEVPYACCSKIQVYYSDAEIVTTLKFHGVLD